MSDTLSFSVIDADGKIVRSGDCRRSELAQQKRPGETLLAGRKLDVGSQVNLRVRSMREIVADLEKRVAVLEASQRKVR